MIQTVYRRLKNILHLKTRADASLLAACCFELAAVTQVRDQRGNAACEAITWLPDRLWTFISVSQTLSVCLRWFKCCPQRQFQKSGVVSSKGMFVFCFLNVVVQLLLVDQRVVNNFNPEHAGMFMKCVSCMI